VQALEDAEGAFDLTDAWDWARPASRDSEHAGFERVRGDIVWSNALQGPLLVVAAPPSV
jgi:hypothetical protein